MEKWKRLDLSDSTLYLENANNDNRDTLVKKCSNYELNCKEECEDDKDKEPKEAN